MTKPTQPLSHSASEKPELTIEALAAAKRSLEEAQAKGPFHIELTRDMFVRNAQKVLGMTYGDAKALGDRLADGNGVVRVCVG